MLYSTEKQTKHSTAMRIPPIVASCIRFIIPERWRPSGYLVHLTRERTSCVVRSGPFAGCVYVSISVGSAYIPKLLGIYERELASKMELICAGRPTLIVDVGAAEGYYAIGLMIRNPQARVVAFETEMHGQEALREMAMLNDVSPRLDIRGKCETLDLASTLEGTLNSVVICDVEGYEEKLLDLKIIPALSRSSILVELHEFIVPGITEELKSRFSNTHRIEQIWQQSRSAGEFPWHTFGTMLLPKSYLDWAVSEGRPAQMSWLWMVPKGGSRQTMDQIE